MTTAFEDIRDDVSSDERQIYHDQFIEAMPRIFPWYQMYRMKDDGSSKAITIKEDVAEKYNDDANQYAIFFTPNGNFKKANGIRRKNTASDIYCFCIDRDDTPNNKTKFWLNFPLPPSLIVETYRWYHAYWLIEPSVEANTHIEKWNNVQKWLCDYMWWDQQAKDVTRMLRMPWYKYWKKDRPSNGFIPSVYFFDESIKYNFDYVYDMFYKSTQVEEQKNDYKKYTKVSGNESNYDRINAEVNVIEILEHFSTRWQLRGVSFLEDGKMTNWYKYNPTNNYIISFSWKDRPEWWPFNVAKYFLKNDADTFKFFAERYKIWEWKKTELKTKKEKNIPADWIDITTNDRWNITIEIWTNTMIISMEDRKIYKQVDWNPPVEIMDGIIKPMWYFESTDSKMWKKNVYIIDYEKFDENTWEIVSWTIYGDTLLKRDALKSLLSKKWLTFIWWKPYDDHLVNYIHKCNTKYEYINKLWIYGPDFVVNEPWLYRRETENGNYLIEISGIEPSDRKANVLFQIWNRSSLKDLEEAVENFTSTYYAPIAQTLFTAYAMGMFAYHIRNEFSRMPLVSLTGITQSGKTTLKQLAERSFGIDPVMKVQAASTYFAVMSMSRHYMPLSATEFQNETQKFDWDTMLKNNYDNSQDMRGNKDQWVNVYELNAMMVMDWEQRSMTNSVYTRTIALQFNKTHRRKIADYCININKYFIDRYDNIKEFSTKYRAWDSNLKARFSSIEKQEKDRIIENYAMLVAFAECFGFSHLVQENIILQCKEQLMLMGEDNMNKIIKKLFGLARMNRMITKVKGRCIIIDYIVDPFKVNKKTDADIQSDIANVNSHFWPNEEMLSDRIILPLDYLFKTKNLHEALNAVLDYAFWNATMTPDPSKEAETRLAIKEYARANKYEERHFYEMINNDHGEYHEQKSIDSGKSDSDPFA